MQLDSISVLARAHELVLQARLGPQPKAVLDAVVWGEGAQSFEYWSHAACVLPLELWPAFAAARRRRAARGRRWHPLPDRDSVLSTLVSRLEAEGPRTARELGGAKAGGTWWDWSETKIGLEWLLDIGIVTCRRRQGFERVYDLAARAIPSALLGAELDDATCAQVLVRSAISALGIGTAADLAATHGLSLATAKATATELELETIAVEGWAEVAFLAPGALDTLTERRRGRVVALSPFDPLCWDRNRLARLFGLTYRLESYVPAPKRVVGYYAMPVLDGDQVVALVDPKRERGVLRARHVVLLGEPDRSARAVGLAMAEAARWVGCSDLAVDRVTPEGARPLVEAALL